MGKKISGSMGRRIAASREELDWTQRQLAEAAEISVTYLSEIENDKRSISWDVLLRIANALGVSLDYLAKGDAEAPTQMRPVTFPPELAQAAEEQNWSLAEARDLLKARAMVVARRSHHILESEPDRRLTKREWIELHRRLFGHEETN